MGGMLPARTPAGLPARRCDAAATLRPRGPDVVPRSRGQATPWLRMSTTSTPKVRHRNFDRLRQKLWAVPARVRLCVFRRGSKAARRPHLPVR
jgi:hypothetical protein